MNWLLQNSKDLLALCSLLGILGGLLWYILSLKIKDMMPNTYTKEQIHEKFVSKEHLNLEFEIFHNEFKSIKDALAVVQKDVRAIITKGIS